MKKYLIPLSIALCLLSAHSQARSSHDMTVGIMGLGNIQLIKTIPDFDIGPGGGAYFDYRFNQRFSLTVDAWVSTHDGTGRSRGDNGIELLGIPTCTFKAYFMDDEGSKWDPYAGIGIGVMATSEGAVENGTNGVGLAAQIELGFDYYFTDMISAGFAGVFRSAGIITNLGSGNGGSAIVPYSLIGKVGFHFN